MHEMTLYVVNFCPELTTKIRPTTLDLSSQRQPNRHSVRIEEAIPSHPFASWYVKGIADFFFKMTLYVVK